MFCLATATPIGPHTTRFDLAEIHMCILFLPFLLRLFFSSKTTKDERSNSFAFSLPHDTTIIFCSKALLFRISFISFSHIFSSCYIPPGGDGGNATVNVMAGDKTSTAADWKPPSPLLETARRSVRAHERDINCVAVSPNDAIVASASQDRTVKLWRSRDLELMGVLKGHKRGVWKVCERECLLCDTEAFLYEFLLFVPPRKNTDLTNELLW